MTQRPVSSGSGYDWSGPGVPGAVVGVLGRFGEVARLLCLITPSTIILMSKMSDRIPRSS